MPESGDVMSLKAITIRLDSEEYERLKENLAEFGDPDINAAYVIRAYIRDLNRALPILAKSKWDLKNYFAMCAMLLKQFSSMSDTDILTKGMMNWTQFWKHSMGMAPE